MASVAIVFSVLLVSYLFAKILIFFFLVDKNSQYYVVRYEHFRFGPICESVFGNRELAQLIKKSKCRILSVVPLDNHPVPHALPNGSTTGFPVYTASRTGFTPEDREKLKRMNIILPDD